MLSSPVIVILVLLAALGAAAVLTVAFNRRRRNVWQRFARRHGLTFREEDEEFLVAGSWQGQPLQLRVVRSGSDGDALGVQNERFSTPVENLPDGLKVESAPGALGSLRKSLEPDAVDVDDPELDEIAVVASASGVPPGNYLTADRKRAIEVLIQEVAPAFVELEDKSLRIEDRTMVSRIEKLEQRSRALVRCAEVLNRSAGK